MMKKFESDKYGYILFAGDSYDIAKALKDTRFSTKKGWNENDIYGIVIDIHDRTVSVISSCDVLRLIMRFDFENKGFCPPGRATLDMYKLTA